MGSEEFVLELNEVSGFYSGIDTIQWTCQHRGGDTGRHSNACPLDYVQIALRAFANIPQICCCESFIQRLKQRDNVTILFVQCI